MTQVNLTVLDLAGNQIQHVENVETLKSLQDFWVITSFAVLALTWLPQFNDNKLFENLDEIDKFVHCPNLTTVRPAVVSGRR